METTASILANRRKSIFVSPSGIEIEIQSLIGKWQKELTQSNEKKRRNAFDEMLKDCIIRIGEKINITIDDVRKLFREDRKAILFEIRQLSNNRNPIFTFDYEFPTKDGKKYKQRYNVEFTPEDFPVKPYKWVRDAMMNAYLEKNELPDNYDLTDSQKSEALSGEFPTLYKDYNEIVEKHKEQHFRLESGHVVVWRILDGEAERKNQNLLSSDSISSHTQLQVREVKYDSPNQPGTLIHLPLDEMDTLDIEAIRSNIVEVEANVETSVVVQYQENTSMQANVDLVTTPAFFFPSLAI